ncbi:L,D-transpeptidase family protein [Streptomyces sp. NPDC014894]|uniref:L,D-transpeptidase family protein n=1 Tax=unclassified Streptomyces TaxID=2593676 RepID=UPI0036F7E1C8
MRGRHHVIRAGADGRAARGRPAARAAVLTAAAALAVALAAPAPARAAGTGHRAEPCTARTGPYQRPVEKYLGLPVDGVQSAADCEAIRAFQTEQALTPADGYASLATYRWTVALQARADPNAAGDCPVRSYRVTCVDLDRQLLWVQRGERVVFQPVPIRTGRDSEETRLGWHSIYWRNRDHVSTIYDNAPMPFAQFFDGGQALHGRLDDLYDGGGSAGCVNLRLPDAEALWNLLAVDDRLYIWGVKPGTDG